MPADPQLTALFRQARVAALGVCHSSAALLDCVNVGHGKGGTQRVFSQVVLDSSTLPILPITLLEPKLEERTIYEPE